MQPPATPSHTHVTATSEPDRTHQAYTANVTREILETFTPSQISEILRDLKTDLINTLRERRDRTDREAKELDEAIKQITKL